MMFCIHVSCLMSRFHDICLRFFLLPAFSFELELNLNRFLRIFVLESVGMAQMAPATVKSSVCVCAVCASALCSALSV